MIHPDPEAVEFHHIGIACDSLEDGIRQYERLGYIVEGENFVDPLQGVRGRFLHGAGPRLELLESLPGCDVLAPWLKSVARMYHLAYVTADLETAVGAAVATRARVVRQPLPAPAFGGRRVAFVMYPGRILIEFIEKEL